MVTDDLDKLLSENSNIKVIYVIPTFQNPTGKHGLYKEEKILWKS